MASAREEGLIKFVAVNPADGATVLLGYKDTRELAPAGKIAEPREWFVMPRAQGLLGSKGWKIQMIMKPEATDILDNANDSIYKIPAFINGVLTTVGKEEFKQETGQKFASPSLTIGVDNIIGQWTLTGGTNVSLGGAKCWIEPMDDTA